MNSSIHKSALLICATAWIVLGAPGALAQTNRTVASPPSPTLKSPVDSFRALLVMPTAERRQLIATRNTNAQERLLRKIREYTNLTPAERDLRLMATELRWYLEPMMHSAATNRADQLALIPERIRPMVAIRIEQWDRIPAPVQQMFLTNEQGAGYFARVAVPTNYPVLPTTQIRRSVAAHINQLFDLTPGEKERVLATLSEAEREQMEKTLAAFDKLTPAQRRLCLNSFKKLAVMSPAERNEFFKNADRWSQMTPAERQSWRELVTAAPTMAPLPNALVAKPPLPHLQRRPDTTAATNGG